MGIHQHTAYIFNHICQHTSTSCTTRVWVGGKFELKNAAQGSFAVFPNWGIQTFALAKMAYKHSKVIVMQILHYAGFTPNLSRQRHHFEVWSNPPASQKAQAFPSATFGSPLFLGGNSYKGCHHMVLAHHLPTHGSLRRCFCISTTFLLWRKRGALLASNFSFVKKDEGATSKMPPAPCLPRHSWREHW